MFLHQNPRRQIIWRVAGHNRNGGLAQNRPVIQRCRDLVHCAAVLGIACLERAGVGVQPFIPWQKRGMDIDHSTGPGIGKSASQLAHETRKANDIWRMRHQTRGQFVFESGAIPCKGFMFYNFGRNAPFFGPSDPARICHIRHHHTGPRGVVAGHVFDQRPHI